MLPRTLLPQTLTLVRFSTGAGAEDEYGNPTLVEETPVTVRGRLDQIGTTETTLNQDTVSDRWRAFLPAGTVIAAGDVIREGGRNFRVDGTPEVVYAATSPHHVEAPLIYTADITYSTGGSASPTFFPSSTLFPAVDLFPQAV